jgi:hypothetical protein
MGGYHAPLALLTRPRPPKVPHAIITVLCFLQREQREGGEMAAFKERLDR